MQNIVAGHRDIVRNINTIFIDPIVMILASLQVLSSDGLPQNQGVDRVLISHLHVVYCELDNEVIIVTDQMIAVFAELIHDFVCLQPEVLIFMVEERHQQLDSLVAVLVVL